ncbi:MAG: DUF362 domain-containing protein [Bacteroidota bacterium]
MENDKNDIPERKLFSRRNFLGSLGVGTAGLLISPYLKSGSLFASDLFGASSLAQVAITSVTGYDRTVIQQKVQYVLDQIGGITDLFSAGKKVGIKINLTGGSGNANNPKLQGVPITECMWTHPEVLRAVGESIRACGVNGSDIYILEALGDAASYNNFGYLDVQNYLEAQMIDLNNPGPSLDFVTKQVGSNKFYWDSFYLNQILTDIDVYVSIPKMKQHEEGSLTCSLKNQIGITPMSKYITQTIGYRREQLHTKGSASNTQLPCSICDLNLARPVHLAVVDGIKNATGGEGAWNALFQPSESNVLLAGKDPVATDTIAAHLMGLDPMATTLIRPGGDENDNYLDMLHTKGIGTNQMNDIELVGDGAFLVSVNKNIDGRMPKDFQLYQNYPNPFNPTTMIRYQVPANNDVTLKVFDMRGREIETIVHARQNAGSYTVRFNASGLSSGTYFYTLQAGSLSRVKEMLLLK